jgi:type IV pilus assembly protein PilA
MTGAQRGFTLIELMVVVIIVGVLATIAVVSFRKFAHAAKTTEASQTVQSIRTAEQAYFAMTGAYYDVSGGWCPGGAVTPSAAKRNWDLDCPSGVPNQWRRLTVKTDGPVAFQYRVRAGTGTGADTMAARASALTPDLSSFNGHTMLWASAAPGPFYIVEAQGDPSNSGAWTARALGHSQTNVVEVQESY